MPWGSRGWLITSSFFVVYCAFHQPAHGPLTAGEAGRRLLKPFCLPDRLVEVEFNLNISLIICSYVIRKLHESSYSLQTVPLICVAFRNPFNTDVSANNLLVVNARKKVEL